MKSLRLVALFLLSFNCSHKFRLIDPALTSSSRLCQTVQLKVKVGFLGKFLSNQVQALCDCYIVKYMDLIMLVMLFLDWGTCSRELIDHALWDLAETVQRWIFSDILLSEVFQIMHSCYLSMPLLIFPFMPPVMTLTLIQDH